MKGEVPQIYHTCVSATQENRTGTNAQRDLGDFCKRIRRFTCTKTFLPFHLFVVGTLPPIAGRSKKKKGERNEVEEKGGGKLSFGKIEKY